VSLPDFEFKPWEAGELALDEPLCAPATSRVVVRVWGRKISYLGRNAKRKDGRTGSWIKRDEPNCPVLSAGFWALTQPEVIARCIKVRKWKRIIAFDSSLNLLSQRADVFTQLVIQQHHFYYSTFWQAEGSLVCPFMFIDRFENTFIRTNCERVHPAYFELLVKQDAQDFNSDCAFSLRWLKSSARDRMNFLCRARCGSLDELEDVLHSLVLTDQRLWQTSQELIWNAAFVRIETFVASVQSSFPLRIVCEEFTVGQQIIPLKPSQIHLIRIIEDHFKCFRVKLKRDYLVLRSSSRSVPLPEIRISSPSQHERLEARLRLREWLQDKVAPEEIPILLGEA